jgi:hypothetical protein
MQFCDAIGPPSGDQNGLIGRSQSLIEMAGPKERFAKIRKHAGFKLETGACRASEVDSLSKLMSARLKIATAGLGQAIAGYRRNPKIWGPG